MSKIILTLAFVLTISFCAFAQNTNISTMPKTTPPPGNIVLLDGYTHTPKRGIDTVIGEISKPDGIKISYDIGRFAGKVAGRCKVKDACLWYKEQNINGRDVWLGMGKEGGIYATFPREGANFTAVAKSPEDIADFLIMILTYNAKLPGTPYNTPEAAVKQ